MKRELMAGTAELRFRLDPRTKLLLLLVINVIMMGGGIEGAAVVVRPVLALIPFTLLLAEVRIKAAMIYLPLFALATFGESYVVPHTAGLMNLLAIIASGLISRFMPCLAMGYYVVTTTTVSEFTASMERMHVTPKLVIPLSVMFRFFPTVLEEAGAISDSMKMRGIGGSSILKDPVAAPCFRTQGISNCLKVSGQNLVIFQPPILNGISSLRQTAKPTHEYEASGSNFGQCPHRRVASSFQILQTFAHSYYTTFGILRPFSLKNKTRLNAVFKRVCGGGRGIRTLETLLTPTRFPDKESLKQRFSEHVLGFFY